MDTDTADVSDAAPFHLGSPAQGNLRVRGKLIKLVGDDDTQKKIGTEQLKKRIIYCIWGLYYPIIWRL